MSLPAIYAMLSVSLVQAPLILIALHALRLKSYRVEYVSIVQMVNSTMQVCVIHATLSVKLAVAQILPIALPALPDLSFLLDLVSPVHLHNTPPL